MKWIRKSLTREIGLAALIIAVVLFASYYSLVSIRLRGYFMDQAERRLMDDSALASKDVEFYIKKYVTMMEQAKNNADFAEFAASVIDKDAKSESSLYPVVKKQLGSIAQLDPDIAMAYLALAKANDIISNTYDGIAISDYDLNKRTWYRAIVDNGKTTVTEPYLDLITGKMTMTIGAPMRYQGEFVGVCAVDITLASVERTMREYKIEKTGYVVLVYNDGHILYHPDYSVGDKATIADALGAEKAAELLSGKSGLTSCIYKGKSKFLYYQPIPDTNLTAVAVIAQTEAYSALNSFLISNSIAFFLVLCICFLLVYSLRSLISSPVIRISQEILSYGKNHGEISLPEKVVTRTDEIGVLARGLTWMSRELSQYVVEIESKNNELTCAKEKISTERFLFQTTIASLADGVFATDKDGLITIMNKAAERLVAKPAEEIIGQSIFAVLKIDTDEEPFAALFDDVYHNGHETFYENLQFTVSAGERRMIEGSAAPIKTEENGFLGTVIVFRDCTEKRQRQEQILYLSYHDQLTGLYNRRFVEEELEHMDNQESLPFSVAMADVNGLKLINDAFGHAAGDELLIRVAKILSTECRKTDYVARIGGDEFVILLPNTDYGGVAKIVKRIYNMFAREKMGDLILSASVGFATKTDLNEAIEQTLKKAEEQMYMKKLTESKAMRSKTIRMIFEALTGSNPAENTHARRVSVLSRRLAEALGLDAEEIKELEYSALMHDIGKATLSDAIINKQGALTETETAELRRHAENGYQMLRSVDTYAAMAEIALSHHERWDGTGYPQRLKGKEIPLGARIVCIADAFEKMTSARFCSDAMSGQAAAQALKKGAGTQFDPELVALFIEKVLPQEEAAQDG